MVRTSIFFALGFPRNNVTSPNASNTTKTSWIYFLGKYDTSRDGCIDFNEFQKFCVDVGIKESDSPVGLDGALNQGGDKEIGMVVNKKLLIDLVSKLRRANFR
jgi:hypothetical protein